MFVDISLKKIIRNKLFTTGLLLLVVLLFSWWSNPTLKPGYSPDTWEHLSLAKDFSDPAGELRPIFYPFFIRLCMQIGGVHWGEVVVLLQMILHTITILFLYKLFIKFNLYAFKVVISGVCFDIRNLRLWVVSTFDVLNLPQVPNM